MKIKSASIIVSVLTFLFGFLLGASKYDKLMGDIKWTDAASISITFFGFLLAFYTYHQWLGNKKKEDAYISAKKYLSAIEQLQDLLNDQFFHYNYMCPAPGVLPESKVISTQRIEHVNKVWHQLYQAKVLFHNSKMELGFWNVSLTKSFEEEHESLIKSLNDISVISTCLNSQLHHLLLLEADNMQEVVREKNMLNEKVKLINEIFTKRVNMGFENVFVFK